MIRILFKPEGTVALAVMVGGITTVTANQAQMIRLQERTQASTFGDLSAIVNGEPSTHYTSPISNGINRPVLGRQGHVFADFKTPFLFTYLSWEKKATIENGKVMLSAEGITPKGGGGCNVVMDLSGYGSLCPVIRVKVGARNTMKSLRFTIADDTVGESEDSKKRGATFEFPLPQQPTNGFVEIYPRDGAMLDRPNGTGAVGNIHLDVIRQWQLMGDWGGDGPVDLEIETILLSEPSAEAKAASLDRIKKQDEEKAQQERERSELQAKYGKRSANSPSVVEVYRVAPDILAVGIQAGKVTLGRYEAYVAQPGDSLRPDRDYSILTRGGKEIGRVLGKKKDGLSYFESFSGDPLLPTATESLSTYSIVPESGGGAIKPIAVWRKSKPTDQAQPSNELAMRHTVYLKLAAPLATDKKYLIQFAEGMNTQQPKVAFTTSDNTVRSEAVHVPQIGFRPDDPVKNGFLSIWLGTGGGYQYTAPPKFQVISAATGKIVFNGIAELRKGKDENEKLWQGRAENYEKTAVYQLDFSSLTAPGVYKLVVSGVGCSYPFTVGLDTWKKAFTTQMKGLFNQRSGVELGPPYTPFLKPKDFYPGSDATILETAYNVVDGGRTEAGEELVKQSTGKPVPQAWGGYHDAGDWNPRRVTHMRVTMAQLELLTIFPEYFGKIRLNIPSKPGVPDVLTEGLFELDLFRRLQKPDGGVPFEIETNGDPSNGNLSWKQGETAYVTAPDPHASWYYAAVAARAAKLLENYDRKLAAIYRSSAIRAMEWAEKDYTRRKENGTEGKINWEMKDARNYAAVLLYDLTGDQRWDVVFREGTVINQVNPNLFQYGTAVQRDAAFAYALLPPSRKPNPTFKANCLSGLKDLAEKSLEYAKGNAFQLTTPDAGKPMFIGFWSTPDAIELCRAHFLTGEKRYLAGAVAACAFSGGGNPGNITYTTGVGANPIKHPFHMDSRGTGQAPPEGLTVYGNFDWPHWPDQQWALWPMQYHLSKVCIPNVYEWPVPEGYFDIYLYPATNEFVVDAWAPNVYVWGYLAARK